MAQYAITHSCGHTVTKQLYGPEASRRRYIAWAATEVCPDCAKADKMAACEALEVAHGLPALDGSPKQVAWARTLRASMITDMEQTFAEMASKVRPGMEQTFEERAAAVMQALYGCTSARWWIDARDIKGMALAEKAYKELRA